MTQSFARTESAPGMDRTSNPRSARILEAARHCFSQKGFQSTTVIDVAETAGVSRPLVYKYFGDKDGLIDSVLRTTFAEWEGLNDEPSSSLTAHPPRLPAPTKDGDSATDALRDKFERAIEFVRRRPIFRSILVQDPEIVMRGHLDGLRHCRAASAARTREILRSGIASGELRNDLDEKAATSSVEMILFGLLERALGIRPELSLDPTLQRTTTELLLSGLRAPGSGS